MIDDRELLNELFDCYYELLTDKQKEYFNMYYCMDYSLGEIASDLGLSRNAVFDQIKKTVNLLNDYEVKLHLLEKRNKRVKLLNELEKICNSNIIEELKKID